MRRLFYFFIIALFFNLEFFSFAQSQSPSSEIIKTEEEIQKEKFLRKKLQAQEKFYIKKIIFEGINLIELESLEEIKSSFENRWLTKDDIDKILDILKEIYLKKNFNFPLEIEYKIKKRNLIIIVKENKP